jgi:fused signal recognition particle receptor
MAEEKKQGWFQRLKSGLSKSSNALSTGINEIFTKRRLDDVAIEDLEDLLITADLGVEVAARVSASLSKTRFDKNVDPAAVRTALAGEIASVLAPVAMPLRVDGAKKPHVILMVGVNGSGKTTTIGKLAHQFKAEGKSVMLAAGDTFRAAAIEQLQIWGQRVGVPVVATSVGSDAASLAFEAMDRATREGVDILFIDTAGRLQNRSELMDELSKVIRVIGKKDESAPHDTLLVLDATTGQNALAQVEVFKSSARISGIIMTKLDGSARGGILVACAEKFGLPVHAIGIGEALDDLQPFDADSFARMIVGLDQDQT